MFPLRPYLINIGGSLMLSRTPRNVKNESNPPNFKICGTLTVRASTRRNAIRYKNLSCWTKWKDDLMIPSDALNALGRKSAGFSFPLF